MVETLHAPGRGACQRWRGRQMSWRHRRDGGFDAGAYTVGPLSEALAAQFVRTHHYAATMPAARMRFGLFTDVASVASDPAAVLGEFGALVGVAVLSVPMRARVLSLVFPDLEPYVESLELGRFVLTDAVPANGETYFLARVLRAGAMAGLRGVVSFSDPVARYRFENGRRVAYQPGHVGVCYQGANAVACGRSTARTQLIIPRTGEVLNARTLAKIRAGESGHAGAERRLIALGARPRDRGQDRRAWLNSALDDLSAVKVAHPGMFRYAFRLGTTASERRRVRVGLPVTSYPKPDQDRVLLDLLSA